MKSLFDNIDDKEIERILKILDTKPIIFSKNEIISTDQDDYNIGILLTMQ